MNEKDDCEPGRVEDGVEGRPESRCEAASGKPREGHRKRPVDLIRPDIMRGGGIPQDRPEKRKPASDGDSGPKVPICASEI